MGKIINLRRVKKNAARAAKAETAEVNRVQHGTPKHLRKSAEAERERRAREVDAHKLDPEKER